MEWRRDSTARARKETTTPRRPGRPRTASPPLRLSFPSTASHAEQLSLSPSSVAAATSVGPQLLLLLRYTRLGLTGRSRITFIPSQHPHQRVSASIAILPSAALLLSSPRIPAYPLHEASISLHSPSSRSTRSPQPAPIIARLYHFHCTHSSYLPLHVPVHPPCMRPPCRLRVGLVKRIAAMAQGHPRGGKDELKSPHPSLPALESGGDRPPYRSLSFSSLAPSLTRPAAPFSAINRVSSSGWVEWVNHSQPLEDSQEEDVRLMSLDDEEVSPCHPVSRPRWSTGSRQLALHEIVGQRTPQQLHAESVLCAQRQTDTRAMREQENVHPNIPRPPHQPVLRPFLKPPPLRTNPHRRPRQPSPSGPALVDSLFTFSDEEKSPPLPHAEAQHSAMQVGDEDDIVPSSLQEGSMEDASGLQGTVDFIDSSSVLSPSSQRPLSRSVAQGHALRQQMRLTTRVHPQCTLTVEEACACLGITMVSVQGLSPALACPLTG
jgi:hypothetical protein